MTLDDIKIGSKWERVQVHGIGEIGEIITVEKKTKYIHYSDGRNLSLETFLQRFRPLSKEERPKTYKLYIKNTEVDSPEMAEFMDHWRRRSDKQNPGKPVYVYNKNGNFNTQCKGRSPEGWTEKGYLSFIKCDNILAYKELEDTCLASLDLTKALDAITIAGDLYNSTSIVSSNLCPEWIPDQHLTSATATTTANQTKGNTMNPTALNMKLEVNGKSIDLCPEAKAAKVKTDLQARKKYTVVVFNIDRSYSETLYFNAKNEDKAIAKMTKILQNPANIGKTATLHREIEVLTTSIPVVKADV